MLPSEKTINRYISLLAAQEEAEDVRSTLHYDASKQSCIDGDWVSIVLKFSDGKEFDLQPIYMGAEDRENIVNLLEETIKE